MNEEDIEGKLEAIYKAVDNGSSIVLIGMIAVSLVGISAKLSFLINASGGDEKEVKES